MKHPVETRARALGLFMDYCTAPEAARILGIPESTVQDWFSTATVDIDGTELRWRDLRDLAESRRALASSDRAMARVERWDWERYTKEFSEDAAQDLETTRKKILAMISEGDEEILKKLSPSQLPKIIEAEMLLQGRSTKIVEMRQTIVHVLAQVVSRNINALVKDGKTKEILLDRIEDDFIQVMSVGADEAAMQKMLK